MKQVIRWILLSLCGESSSKYMSLHCVLICILYIYLVEFLFLGWLGVVKCIQQSQTVCKTVYSKRYHKLDIKCNTDETLYIYRLTLNYLAKNPTLIADNISECQKSLDSSCFLSIPADLPWSYSFYRKISKLCNENHKCTLEFSDFYPCATKFRDKFVCSNIDIYYIRVGCSYECLPCKYIVVALIKCIIAFLHIKTAINESFENIPLMMCFNLWIEVLFLPHAIAFYFNFKGFFKGIHVFDRIKTDGLF